jgi:hypothetical protein
MMCINGYSSPEILPTWAMKINGSIYDVTFSDVKLDDKFNGN